MSEMRHEPGGVQTVETSTCSACGKPIYRHPGEPWKHHPPIPRHIPVPRKPTDESETSKATPAAGYAPFGGKGADQYNAVWEAMHRCAERNGGTEDDQYGIYTWLQNTPRTTLVVEIVDMLQEMGFVVTPSPSDSTSPHSSAASRSADSP